MSLFEKSILKSMGVSGGLDAGPMIDEYGRPKGGFPSSKIPKGGSLGQLLKNKIMGRGNQSAPNTNLPPPQETAQPTNPSLFEKMKQPLQSPAAQPQPSMQGEANANNRDPGQAMASLREKHYAAAQKFKGMDENQNRGVLQNFFKKAGGMNLDPKKTAWCAGFANAVIKSGGGQGTGSLAAKSFLQWGKPTDNPQQGDIVVLHRTNNPAKGHVGFYAGRDRDGNIRVLGGNQDNSVSVKTYPASRLAGFRTATGSKQDEAIPHTLMPQGGAPSVKKPQAGPSLMNRGEPVQNHINLATQHLTQFEGYRDKPYWDVNAHRIGYGSDTITKADGKVVKVKPGMKITKADAERDLARRIPQFEKTIQRQTGDSYSKLAPNVKAALISVAYNYGSLPKSVAAAVKTGDPRRIAEAVKGLQGHNKGVNRKRRLSEASLIMGGE